MRGETLAGADVVVAADVLVRLDAAVRALAGDGAACALSGGIDSAVLVALLVRARLLTSAYTLAADFDDDAELTRAFASARHAGVVHHRLVTLREEDLPDRFEATVRANRAPVINGKAVATFVLLETMRARGERRFFSGLGADELLDGDPRGQARWRAALARDREQLARLEDPEGTPQPEGDWMATVLLPPTVNAARSLGLEACLPYLDERMKRWADGQTRTSFQRGELGKWPLRAAAWRLVQASLRVLPKTPRLAPAGGGSARSRTAWNDLLARLCAPARLARLVAPAVDVARVTALRDEHAGMADIDPRRAGHDRVLLTIASRTVLQESEPSCA